MTLTKAALWSLIGIATFHTILYAVELMARYGKDLAQHVGL